MEMLRCLIKCFKGKDKVMSEENIKKNRIKNLIEDIESKNQIGGTMILLNSSDSLEFICKGTKEGYEFVGMEGFHVYDDKSIQPNQDLSTDRYDYKDKPDEFLKDTGGILLSHINSKNVAFEVVFDKLHDLIYEEKIKQMKQPKP